MLYLFWPSKKWIWLDWCNFMRRTLWCCDPELIAIITNSEFATFSGAPYTSLSPSLLTKLFLELCRQLQHKTMCYCCRCSLHNDMQQWEKVVNKCTPKFKLKMKREITIWHSCWGFLFPVFFLSNSCISLVHPLSHAAVCLRLHWMNDHEWSHRKCIFTKFLLFTVVKKSLKMWVKWLLQG